MSVSNARQKRIATQYGIASGGAATDITVSGVSYKLHTFTSDGNFVVTTGGWFDCLLFGGGSAGQYDSSNGGGGAAGGISQRTTYLSPGTYAVKVGSGGAQDNSGLPSSIGTLPDAISAAGGQYSGASASRYVNIGPIMGGSNGNAVGNTNIQGYVGGNGLASNGGGGGGGTTSVGGAASSSTGGNGGTGYDVSAFIGGSTLYKGCGGGGGGVSTGGTGGNGVGANGAAGAAVPASAAANTASGGGGRGSGAPASGSTGGSGIVYIRRRIEGDALATTQGYGVATGASSPTSITVDGVSYNLLAFTSDGTLTVTTPGLFDVLIIGGGGGGSAGAGGGYRGGGGSAGGLIRTTLYIPAATYNVDIGSGGAANASGSVGGIVPLVYSTGGTRGGDIAVTSGLGAPGVNGGGGGGGLWGAQPGGTGVTGFGFNGSAGVSSGDGGAGAGVTANAVAAVGGAGFDVSAFISGSSSTIGVGGNGGTASTAGATGAANTGNGGGGGGSGAAGGAGGSGIIYVRFRTA